MCESYPPAGDNAFLYWLPYEKDVVFGLLSLRTDISKAANPVLEFRHQGQGNTNDVFVAKGIGDIELVKTIKLKGQSTDGWALAQVPLSEYKVAGAVNFEIRLTANDNDDEHTWSVPVDHITVRDLVDVDMRVVTGSASATSVAPGDKVTFKAHVHRLLCRQRQLAYLAPGIYISVNGSIAEQRVASAPECVT